MPKGTKRLKRKASEYKPSADSAEEGEEEKLASTAPCDRPPSSKQIRNLITEFVNDPKLPSKLRKMLKRAEPSRRMVNALNSHVFSTIGS
jgi:hypothetical protein